MYKKLSNFSIASKIIIISAVLAAIFLGFSFGYAINKVRHELSTSVTDRLVVDTKNEVSSIETITKEIDSRVLALSETPPIQGIIRARASDGYDEKETSSIEQWQHRLESIFVAEMRSNDHYLQLRYLDEDGNELVRVNESNGKITIVSGEGLQNKADRDYFKKGLSLEDGDIYISSASLNREGQPSMISLPYTPTIRYIRPIFDEVSGERKGMFIANVSVDDLIKEERISDEDYINSYIIDEKGYYISNTDSGKKWGGPEDLNTGANFFSEFPNIIKSNILESGILGDSSEIFVYSKVHIDPGRDQGKAWFIIKRVPTGILFADINNLVKASYVIGIVTFIVLFFVFYFSIKKLLNPLKDLANAAQKIGEGDFDYRVNIQTEDEIGQLGNVFNQMAEQLRKSYSDLEKKVEERTEQLERSNQLMIGREVKMAELKKEIKSLEEKKK